MTPSSRSAHRTGRPTLGTTDRSPLGRPLSDEFVPAQWSDTPLLAREADGLLDLDFRHDIGAVPWTGPPPAVAVAVNLHGRGPDSTRALAALRPGRLIAFGAPGAPGAPVWRADEHEVARWCRQPRATASRAIRQPWPSTSRRTRERGGLAPDAVVAGRTDVTALASLVAGARRVLCGDTGVAHLATATGTPSVVLFGPVGP